MSQNDVGLSQAETLGRFSPSDRDNARVSIRSRLSGRLPLAIVAAGLVATALWWGVLGFWAVSLIRWTFG